MTKPKIGVFALESLTTGMYTNPLDAVREYVQNGTDSIRDAEALGLLPKGTGRIELIINPQTRTLLIRDNGVGISKDEAFEELINIGLSKKKYDENTGFRGIGRLAGIAYCSTLTFRTSYSKEKVQSVLEINCDELKKLISPSDKKAEELSEVLLRCSKFSNNESAKKDEHFFEVCLHNINLDSNDFLDYLVLEEYLSQVAPVGFDAQRFVYAPIINKWLKNNSIFMDIVTLVIKAPGIEREVFKPYKTRYQTRGKNGNYEVQVKDIVFFPNQIDEHSDFWGWYGKTDLLGMLDDQKAAGFRLRKNNFALGIIERTNEIFTSTARSNTRFNSYYIGEIHVLNKSAIPNARRDGFEDIKAWPSIREKLVAFAKERCDEIRATSNERNKPTEKVVSSAQRLMNDTNDRLAKGLASTKEKELLLNNIEKEESKLEIAIKARQSSNIEKDKSDIDKLTELKSELQNAKEKLEQNNNFVVMNIKASLDRKQRKVLEEVLLILVETLDVKEYKKARDAILERFSNKGHKQDG